MRIYIACGLTFVPREHFQKYAEFLHNVASRLMSQGHSVKYALVNSDPQLAEHSEDQRARLCYDWDRRMVEEADLVLADATFPSIGLGIELQLADDNDTPVLLLFSREWSHRAQDVVYENPDHSRHHLQIGEGYVSLMALGLPSIARIVGYDNAEQGAALAVGLVAEHYAATEEFERAEI